jgi:hypothetical protein
VTVALVQRCVLLALLRWAQWFGMMCQHQPRSHNMKTRIEHCCNGTGLCWFLDVFVNGGWKNFGSYRTEQQAKDAALSLKGG